MAGSAAAADPLTTATACVSVPMSSTNWAKPLSLAKFDPTLGVLQKVSITASLKLEGQVKAESLDAAAATITATVSAHGTFAVAAQPTLAVDPVITRSFQATASDGVTDFAGTSGFDTNVVSTEQKFPTITLTGAAVAPYSGVGTWGSTAVATGTSIATGAGNLVAVVSNRAQADVCVVYEYIPPPPVTTTTVPVTMPPTTSPTGTTISPPLASTPTPSTTIVGQLPPTTGETPGGELPPTGRSSGSIAWTAASFTAMGALVMGFVRRRRRRYLA